MNNTKKDEYQSWLELTVLRDKIKTLSTALLHLSNNFPAPYREIVYVFATEAIRSASNKYHLKDAYNSDEDFEYFRTIGQ